MHIASFRLKVEANPSKTAWSNAQNFPHLLKIVTIQQIHHIKSRSDLSFYWVWPNIIDLQCDVVILTKRNNAVVQKMGTSKYWNHQNLQISPSTCLDCIKGKSSRLSRGLAASLRSFPHLPHLGWCLTDMETAKLPWSVVQLSCILVVMHWHLHLSSCLVRVKQDAWIRASAAKVFIMSKGMECLCIL